jgi:hypothetical protein
LLSNVVYGCCPQGTRQPPEPQQQQQQQEDHPTLAAAGLPGEGAECSAGLVQPQVVEDVNRIGKVIHAFEQQCRHSYFDMHSLLRHP